MWIVIVCLFVSLYVAPNIIIYLKARNRAHEANHESEGIPELSVWAMLWRALMSFTLHWNKPSYEMAYDLGQTHGPVHMVKPGKIVRFRDDVWVNNTTDFDLAKKVMTSATWSDRLPLKHYLHKASFSKPLGLFFGCSDYYKRPHRLLMRLLHQFDFFKPSRMENKILFEALEVEAILDELIQYCGDGGSVTFCPHTLFERNTLNITLQIMMSHRFPRGDSVAEEIMMRINKFNRAFRPPFTILEIIPWLEHVPWFTFLGSFVDASHYLNDVFREIIAEKRRNLGLAVGEPQDLVEGFIMEIDKRERKDEYISDENLLVVLRDMLLAGVDTVNSTLEHCILHLSLNPEIQRRVQAEIDVVIGHTKAPQYSDKARMPYTQAVLLEVLRIGSPVPITSRTSADATTLRGTKLNKNTVVLINIYGIHRSEKMWEDPLVFRPERFLTSNNEITNADKILPFGLGKRSCLGESVALVSLFIFFVTIFRKFSFRIPLGHPPPSLKNTHGMSRCPIPFYVEMRRRVLEK